MSQFKGMATVGMISTNYSLYYDDELIPFCRDVVRDMEQRVPMENRRYCKRDTAFGWGYEGVDPEVLAITLLGFYFGASMPGANQHDIIVPAMDLTPCSIEFVKQHYLAFTSEVIANLSDNWTMTMEDIDKWVKGKEQA